ncbi:MAG: sodium/solute symporter [Ignisphaera sp.]
MNRLIVAFSSTINIDTVIIFAVMCLTIAIGFIGYRASKTLTGFIFANKTLGPWLLAFSIMATYFSAASFLGGGGATYLYNLGFGAWLTAWHVIGVVILWIAVAGKLFDYVSKNKVMSIPELIEHRYRSVLARAIAATIIISLFTLYLVSVYKGGAVILSTQLGIDLNYALLLLALPVIIYIVIGGLKAAAINNLFLGSLMIIAAILTFSYIMSHVGGPINGIQQLSQTTIAGKPGSLWLKLDGMGPPPAMEKNAVPILIMSIAFSIGMAQIALPNLLIQFYAARDVKAISRGRLIGPLLVAIYASLMFSLGAFCHLILDKHLSAQEVAQLMKDTDWVIPKTISLIAPIGVRGLILAAPVAASMSTIALTVLTLSNTLVRDIVQIAKNVKDEEKLLRIAKLSAIAFSLIPIVLALIENRLIIDIVSAAFGTIFACFIGPVTIGIYWRKATKEGAITSMVIGALTGILWYIYLYRVLWIHSTLPATALALTVFIILSLLKRGNRN